MPHLLHLFTPAALLLSFLSCERVFPECLPAEAATVLFPLDTKSPGAGEYTCRAALFDLSTQALTAQGTYCSLPVDHQATVAGGIWLSPCRVDAAGLPLREDGTPAAALDEADRDARYGLRGSNGPAYLVAASPAAAFSPDGSLRYYSWEPDRELYVSDPVPVTLSGTWLDGEYVYASSTALVLRDRRAGLCVRIECGELAEAYIQRITLRNCTLAGRWYLTTGFSTAGHTSGDVVLYDCGGAPMHLVRADGGSWTSARQTIPAIDYQAAANAELRPQVEILLGDDSAHPSRALVDLTEPVSPMTDYTYCLRVSKSHVVVTLLTAAWDDGGTLSGDDSESPGVIGTVRVDGWTTPEGAYVADAWNDHF